MTKVLITLLILFLWSCAPDKPYEQQITRYFANEAKVIPIINEIKVDTSATMESYADYWKNRINELKVDLKTGYEKKYIDDKETYERRAKQNEERAKKWRIKNEDVFGADFYYKSMVKNKNKLDSAQKGLFNYSVIDIFEKLSKEKTKLHQLTVKYKLNESGPIMIQKFVIEELESDTTVYPTDETILKFIQKSGIRRE